MSADVAIQVRNHVTELARLHAFLAAFWASNQLPKDALFGLDLALEEIFANVIFHGYRDGGEHAIHVGLALRGRVVSLTVEDEGVPFNPLDAPAADDTSPIEARPIGGLGIHLLRKLMDEIEYAREGNRNRLVVRKRVSGST
jgi:anti-sigma regulatory factor (Ser/Thr protein kinase)